MKNSPFVAIKTPAGGTERILALHLSTTSGSVYILNISAPTLYSALEVKDQFYEALDDAISRMPSMEDLYMLGDSNSRLGADSKAWTSCLGHDDIGRINENRQRLLELCCLHGLCMTNTYFQYKELYKVSWNHPQSHHWHQLDLIITRHVDLSSVL